MLKISKKCSIVIILQANVGGTGYCISDLRHSVHCGVPVAFHNGSNHDFHLMTKHLTKNFNWGGWKRFGENAK